MDSDDRTLSNSRLEGIQDILDGKFEIRRGLDELCEALRDTRCGREYEAQKNIVEGVHHIKEGICLIKKGLCKLRGQVDRKHLKEIRKGICVIKRGLENLCRALNDLCCGKTEEAEKNLVNGICRIEEGLCMIDKDL
jgi:hypothetical protein